MQGSGGGPSEGNVSGYLLRSTATRWAKDSVLAVDAGTHLAGIIRILENYPIVNPPSTFKHNTPDSITETDSASTSTPPIDECTSATNLNITSSSRCNTTVSSTTTTSNFAFAGLQLPSTIPRTNAAYITRELVSTYLITHTHLDHLSGFVINTASFSPTEKPKRLAALPNAINAVKTHIFNDVIWPNLSDEDAGAGLVTYQRLPIASENYISVCEGLSTQAWPVSHGHCMKQHMHWGRKSNAGLDPDAETKAQRKEKWCVIDSAVYFIRDEATGKEVMMWGDVEPDVISLDARNRRVWVEAAQKIHAGTLSAIFIECSYDCSQSDATLYGHLSPPHLLTELLVLAEQVSRIRDRREKKRKRQSNGVSYATHPTPPPPRRNSTATPPPDINLPLDRDYCSAGDHDLMPPPPPFQNPPPPPLPNKDEPPPLLGVRIMVTHIKDTLREGEDVPANVLRDLITLSKDMHLGCTFEIARQGEGYYI